MAKKKNSISATEQLKIEVTPPEPRKRTVPRSAYTKENPSPFAWAPGVSGNPTGKRKSNDHLLSKSLHTHLAARAPDAVCTAVGCEKYSTWSSVLGMALLLRATLQGDVAAAALIGNLTELGSRSRAAIEEALAGAPTEIVVVFEEAIDGRPVRSADVRDLMAPPSLPAPVPPTVEGEIEELTESDAPTPATQKSKRKVRIEDRFETALARLAPNDRSPSRAVGTCFRPGTR